MRTWREIPIRLATREDGATMVEYALMVALIALAVVATVTALGPEIRDLFTPVSATLPG